MGAPRPPPLQILLSEYAERPFRALPPAVRAQVQRILESIAALAAVAPPIDPLWLKMPHVGKPLMRFTYADVEVFYEIDSEVRTLRITSLHPVHAAQAAG